MKIFLATVPATISYVEDKKHLFILMSYEYWKNKTIEFQEIKSNSEMILLDSGAFTFHSKKDIKIDWNNYIEEYAKFINKNKVDYFFELDIDVIVGLKEVERLREKLEKLTNKKSIPVWHKNRGIDYWKKMVDEYDYIAMSDIYTVSEKKAELINRLVNYANSKNVKVHGLAFTKFKFMGRIKFYSVDSTSWLGAMFGYRLFHFRNGKMTAEIIKGVKKKMSPIIINNNYNQWKLLQYFYK